MDDVVMYLRGLVPGRRAVFALVIGALSGWLASVAGMPLPWMLGPMIGNTLAAVLSLPVRGPDRLRPLVIPVIGVMLGSAMRPEMFSAASRYAASFALLLPFLAVTALVSYAVYRRIGHYDPVTAFFSAMPGGLNDMLILGGAAGGNEKRIALAHAARVLLVILFVVLFYGYALDVSSGEVARGTAASALSLLDWTLLGAAAVAGVPLGGALRLPAPQITGPMLLSGALHLAGLVTVAPPGFLIVVAQLVIGTVIGVTAGYLRGFYGAVLMRFTDLMMAFPALLLAICLAAIFQPSLWIVAMVIAIVNWVQTARVLYTETTSLAEREFIAAEKTLGAGHARILIRHILPHLVPTIIVWGTLGISTTVLLEATLSFLGIGVQPPTPSWGNIIFENQTYFQAAPWLVFFPGAAILILALSFNLLGDALRDVLDPTQRGRD